MASCHKNRDSPLPRATRMPGPRPEVTPAATAPSGLPLRTTRRAWRTIDSTREKAAHYFSEDRPFPGDYRVPGVEIRGRRRVCRPVRSAKALGHAGGPGLLCGTAATALTFLTLVVLGRRAGRSPSIPGCHTHQLLGISVTFLPLGIVGGDVVKAWMLAHEHSQHRARPWRPFSSIASWDCTRCSCWRRRPCW